jgi:hypothetical protein
MRTYVGPIIITINTLTSLPGAGKNLKQCSASTRPFASSMNEEMEIDGTLQNRPSLSNVCRKQPI